MDDRKLLAMAEDIKKNSYSPYSKFRVGAAVLAKSGKVFTGVNIENASFGATVCAERTAVFKAVSEGEREIAAVAISSDSDEYTFPCGICRQVLREFGDDDTKVICGNKNGEFTVFRLGELLPNAFFKF
ncbi:MAG TPA: cytidine deaminase [Hungateiclostridium thermocellum]|jgi:cytidine deaminase|uniref:Cytidine deaminase n=2 Tax=Acetivibrio thermocellus TaxID=1515 RepID=A3DEC1_ACET2|nr:cytidine deaminase [Acetivibrio thermocellus]CDG35764.1 cytidine deaminase [Acetivibrio thermocellus BC1]ABN52300.1 cytidine deaminase [Acetivibrio thermocellus ATCC 27405]ADU74209.1 cytidine deaminase [Acetivibrio thermocellus DSM 1313]ALX08152.1 cytidine deaminase [Acetivibrio thermocellus AD2]ANV75899.1 cytidine deaminase [Acetivibrio thermocellus DSM 2360]